MANLNKVMIIGNVGRDPEMRYTPNGNPVTSFSVATNRVYTTPEGSQKKETEWFNIVTWNKLAETCNQYVTKGKQLYVEGRLQTRNWDGQDGQKHTRVEIVANAVKFLDRQAATTTLSEEPAQQDEIEPEDLPL